MTECWVGNVCYIDNWFVWLVLQTAHTHTHTRHMHRAISTNYYNDKGKGNGLYSP